MNSSKSEQKIMLDGGKYSLFTRIEVNKQPYFIIIVTLKENVYEILSKLPEFSNALGNILKTFF